MAQLRQRGSVSTTIGNDDSTVSRRESTVTPQLPFDEEAQLVREDTTPRLERQQAETSQPSSRQVTFSEGPTIFGDKIQQNSSDTDLKRQKTFYYKKPEAFYATIPKSIDWFMVVILVITLVLIILFATKTITMLSTGADIVIVSALAIGLILIKFAYNSSKKTIAGYIKNIKQREANAKN